MPLGHLYVFFGEMAIQVFCPFVNWVVWVSFDIELYELFIYFGYQPLIGDIICKYFLPFGRMFFLLLMIFFAVQKFYV